MSKGREKPSLMTFSRELVDRSEIRPFFDELVGASDRACAILGGAVVDQVLVFQLHGAMRELSRKEFLELFFDNRALLQTMAARIDLSYALSLNERHEIVQLHAIRRIRNAFAHALRPISFATKLVERECAKLSESYFAKDPSIADLPESRRRFIGICAGIYGHFHNKTDRPPHYEATLRYLKSPDLSEKA